MSDRVQIEPLSSFQDSRGVVFKPLLADELAQQRDVHVVVTEPGCVRGNHRHQHGTESMTVYGPALVRCQEGDTITDTEVAAGDIVRFTIPAGVAHAVKNTGDRPSLMVVFNSDAYNDNQPDVTRVQLFE
ncbi:cupin domain-containing protein [Leptolyngbya sp. AN02str]|uniref:polysaccharide biosynthesis C-terminal domain-containing protein n=1 Tax=Leptolyngbya sp. AN02str TaxID=3423363 RepID=UPI003D31813E